MYSIYENLIFPFLESTLLAEIFKLILFFIAKLPAAINEHHLPLVSTPCPFRRFLIILGRDHHLSVRK